MFIQSKFGLDLQDFEQIYLCVHTLNERYMIRYDPRFMQCSEHFIDKIGLHEKVEIAEVLSLLSKN